MKAGLTLDETCAARAVRRAVCRAADKAIALLDGPGADAPETVHRVRKAIKRQRALLRLVRPGLPAFTAEDAALRDTARHLAPLRDSDVTLATLAGLPGGQAAFPACAAALSRQNAALRDPGQTDRILRRARKDLAAFRKRIRRWKPRAQGFDIVQEGLARSHDTARKGLARVTGAPTPARLHDWRKSIRAMQYQLGFLEPLWPEAIGPRLQAASDLGEALGLYNDLDLLAARAGDLALPKAEAAALGKAIAARQQDLLQTALPAGRRLCAGTGAAQAAVWADLWDASGDARAG